MRLPSSTSSPTAISVEIQPGRWLDSRLALWLPGERLLVVADLHWGYAASHRARGNLLPVWGDDEIETRLTALIATYAPVEMLWLGDIVHAAEGSARAEQFLGNSPVPITLLAGNHDRRWRTSATRAATGAAAFPPPGSFLTRANYFFHHGDRAHAVPAGCLEIIGHHHPAANWGDNAGSRLKLPAVIANTRRLILPAFSPWAAGTPWNDQLTSRDTLWVIAPHRIFAFPRPTRADSATPV